MTIVNRFVLVGIGTSILASAAFFTWSVFPLASIHSGPTAPTKVLARDGSSLYQLSGSDGATSEPVKIQKIPRTAILAVLAAEDKRFYSHHGVDLFALARVVRDAAIQHASVGGASTIEQQYIRLAAFGGIRPSGFASAITQKLRIMIAASVWSLTRSKDDTMERYLNAVPFGGQAIGIGAASRTYFRKDVADLTLAESAMLAGLIQAPGERNPNRNLSGALKRGREILKRMNADGFISDTERDEAVRTDVTVFAAKHPIKAPHAVFRILDDLESRIPDIRTGGYSIRTTIDPELQSIAEAAVERRLAGLEQKRVNDAAVVVQDPRTGEILAYVGSADYFDEAIQGAVDMADAKRQPGSALKPFLYFTAFMRGPAPDGAGRSAGPSTIVPDLPVRYETAEGKPYYPRNYGYRSYGPVSIRDALGSSLNVPAVRVLHDLGLEAFFGTLSAFGLTFPELPSHYGLGIVLGGGEVTLTDATNAYAEMAKGTRSLRPVFVSEVKDANGNVIEGPTVPKSVSLFNDANRATQAAYLVTDILRDPTARMRAFGESNLLDVERIFAESERTVAVKTGTTKDFRDNWAFGYSPKIAVGVWVGNADNEPMRGVTGVAGAVPIWNDIMRHLLSAGSAFASDEAWNQPNGIVHADVCVTSGLLATNLCPKKRSEIFFAGSEPTKKDDWYVAMDIDAATGKRFVAGCRGPSVSKIFLVPPPEFAAWVALQSRERPPTEDCLGRPIASAAPCTGRCGAPIILSPMDGEVFEPDANIDPVSQGIPFVASGSGPFHWILDGRPIQTSDATLIWKPVIGEHVLTLDGSNRQIRFTVR